MSEYKYVVKVLDAENDTFTSVEEKSWTKAKRRIVRTCVIGGADGASLAHREPSKSIICVKDGKGIYRAFIGEGRDIQAKLMVDGKVFLKGTTSLVVSAYNMLDYRWNKLQEKNIPMKVVEVK